MKTEISAGGVAFLGFGSLTYQLIPCRFCGAAAGEVHESQLEHDSWTAQIDCSGCEAALTMQYTSPSPEEAVDCVIGIWNGAPT